MKRHWIDTRLRNNAGIDVRLKNWQIFAAANLGDRDDFLFE
jgi:hypothetical protein